MDKSRRGFIDHTPLIAVAVVAVIAIVVVAALQDADQSADSPITTPDDNQSGDQAIQDNTTPWWLPFTVLAGGMALMIGSIHVHDWWQRRQARRRASAACQPAPEQEQDS